jgi:hypothetical protein
MTLFRALLGIINAATVFIGVIYPAMQRRAVCREIEAYEDEIYRLGIAGDSASKLRIETISRRRERATAELVALRSAANFPNTGEGL